MGRNRVTHNPGYSMWNSREGGQRSMLGVGTVVRWHHHRRQAARKWVQILHKYWFFRISHSDRHTHTRTPAGAELSPSMARANDYIEKNSMVWGSSGVPLLLSDDYERRVEKEITLRLSQEADNGGIHFYHMSANTSWKHSQFSRISSANTTTSASSRHHESRALRNDRPRWSRWLCLSVWSSLATAVWSCTVAGKNRKCKQTWECK